EPGQSVTVNADGTLGPVTPSATPHLLLQLDVNGPASPFLTDAHHRSVGIHPQAGVYGSQIPRAWATTSGSVFTIRIPDPDATYELVLAAQGAGGPFVATATVLVDGAPAATLPLGGTTQPGQLLGTTLTIS